jgi:long-chain acyl-CoA synthetase
MGDETLARMFWRRVEGSADRPAEMVKADGHWRTLAWREVGDTVRELALGLLALGLRRGEAVALLSKSRADWVHADFAILSAGCVTVPIYPSYTPEQIAWIVNDAEVRTLIVEDAVQLAKALEVRDRMPGLAEIVVIEDGEPHAPPVLSWATLRRRGREHAGALASALADRLASVGGADVASIVYTSGTTGEPKGVVQTHANHMASLDAVARIPGVEPGDVHLLFLPLAHAFARLEAFLGVHRGLVTAFAESLDRVADDLREVRPHFIFAVPRLFEKVHARLLSDVAAGSAARRRVFGWAMAVGARASRLAQAGRPLPPALALTRALAHRLVFSKLHRALGGRLRFAVSGGAPLAAELAEFFHAAGLLIVEGYGLTETCPALTFNRIDRFKFGSVGQPLPGVELRLAADGEILARGPNVATRGYWKQPRATAEAFDAEGWLHTGDIGRLDAEGFLYITDRKKDLIVTAGGINIAPQLVENLLRADPLVSQAMVYGDRRPYPVALVTLSPGEVVRLARAAGLLVEDPARLATQPVVVEHIARVVEAANVRLPSYARVKKFAVLPEELTEEAGELTPTQKVKRRIVADKYREILEGLYRD